MNVRPVAILAMSILVAAGCSRQPEPGVADVPQEPAATAQAAKKPAAGTLQNALPEGVVLEFDYHVRNDSVVEKEGKRDRRRVGMEYLGGDQETTFASIGRSLAAAGFEIRDRKDMDNGNIRAKFSKPRYGTVVVTVTREMDAKPRNPDAIGRVLLDWPVPKAD